ncbi:hypothetical protein [Burkholderia phage FLC9]|nr:hypothetical protein [Burkholderia phage FLC9]
MLNDREKKLRTRRRMVSEQHQLDVEHAQPRERTNTRTKSGEKPAEKSMNTVIESNDQQVHVPVHPLVLEDGVKHINIDTYAKTDLGKMLVHKYPAPFEHPKFGRFRSVEGFWGYIRTGAREDRWRYLSGMPAKRETRNLDKRWIKNFHQIIMEANFHKVNQNEDIKKLMLASTLPFDHYYIFRSEQMKPDDPGLPTRPQIASWLCEGFEDIRRLLREGKQPEVPDYEDVYLGDNEVIHR